MSKYKLTVTKAGLGQPEKVLKVINVDELDGSLLDRWFDYSHDYIKNKLRENGIYSETIGQMKRAKLEKMV